MLLLADKWKEYELIDLGGGEKLERWGDYVLRRPGNMANREGVVPMEEPTWPLPQEQ